MRPQLLELRNFLAFADTSVDLAALRGLVLLSGEHRGRGVAADSNGAGKSALIDGLCWALYGKMARPKHRAEDVVRRAVGTDTLVRLVFLDAHGRSVEIRRYRKHAKFKDGLFLEIEGADARGSSAAETQQRIDALVGLDHETFVGSVLYTQHPLRGRFAELSDEQKKDLLESILGVEVLSKARDLCKRDLRARELEVGRAELTCRSLLDQLAWLDRQRAEYRDREAAWASDHAARQEAQRTRMGALRVQIEAHSRKEPALASAPDLSTAIHAAQRELDAADAAARAADAELERQITGLCAREGGASALLRRLQDDAAKFEALGEVCPICTQPITAHTRERHLDGLEDQMASNAAEILELRRGLAALDHRREAARAASDTAKHALEKHIGELRAELEASRLARVQLDAWNREGESLARQLDVLTRELDALAAEQNTFGALREKADAEHHVKETNLAEAERDLERLRGEAEQLAFWDRGFGPRGLKSYLFDSVLPLLNERARFYAGVLTGGTLAVQFSTTIEKDDSLEDRFTVHVQHKSGVDSYSLLSGGERQRVNLIINLALQDLVGSRAARPLPIAIYDEAFEGLDRTGVEAAVRVLEEAGRAKDLVLVVTHQDGLRDLFQHELRVVCDRGGSFVETVSP